MTQNESAPLSPSEREQLEWLRTENAFLKVQRDILMRVATGFAQDARAWPRDDDH
jgi:hypothetical protein